MLATEAIQLESCLCVEVEIGWVRVVSKDWPSYVVFRCIEQPTSHGIVCFSRKFDAFGSAASDLTDVLSKEKFLRAQSLFAWQHFSNIVAFLWW